MIRKAHNKYVSCSSRIPMIRHNFHGINKIILCFSFYKWNSNRTRKKTDLLARASISLDWLRIQCNIFAGADPGIFYWGRGRGQSFGSERIVELFCGKLLFPHTPSHQSLTRQRRLRVSQSVKASHRWRGKYCFASRGEQITGGTQRQSHFWISPEFNLVVKYNTRFIKNFGRLISDIRSYGPPWPSSWIHHCFGALWYPFYRIR